MDHSGREDRKLSEVKALLRRLQGLPADHAAPADLPSAAASRRFPRRTARAGVIALAAVPTMLVFAAVMLVVAYVFPWSKDAQRSAATNDSPGARPGASPPRGADGPKAPVVGPALEAALALVKSGRVQLARERLLAMASDGSPDVAWALARSYDPSSLKAIPGADAGPDIDEAARWYRTWYAAAVKQGMVADSVSLERIIGSMQR